MGPFLLEEPLSLTFVGLRQHLQGQLADSLGVHSSVSKDFEEAPSVSFPGDGR